MNTAIINNHAIHTTKKSKSLMERIKKYYQENQEMIVSGCMSLNGNIDVRSYCSLLKR